MRRKIAVFAAQIDEATQTKFLSEFIDQAYSYDFDVCIFTMYQKYQETALRNIGDSNIFTLANLKFFDAAVVLSDTIMTPGVAHKLQKRLKENFDGPVLIIDEISDFYESVMMDYYKPMRKIIDHLIEEHGYKDIAFLSGKKGHPHSIQRLNAYIDSMKAHNLPIREDRIFHGNYWYDSGAATIEKLISEPEDMPEALACANDYMAIGAASALAEMGLRIPDTIAITGYDSVDDGRFGPEPLTSADIPAGYCGRYSMRKLYSMMNNTPMEEFEYDSEIFVGSSCGCKREVEMVPRKLRTKWRTQQSSRSMFSDFNHIMEDMLTQKNLNGFLQTIVDYTNQIMPFELFDFYFNDGFLTPDTFVGDAAIRNGYTEYVHRVLTCRNLGTPEGDIDLNVKIRSADLCPYLNAERDYPTTFIFNPLYFDDRCFGYTVMNYGTKTKVYNKYFRIWMRNIMQGIEALYRQVYMSSLVEKIKASQIRDSLTGLYNYTGFINFSDAIISEHRTTGAKTGVITVDIKGLKQLNEIYGRKIGERAISALARSIQNSIFEDELCCRMCNDEFLIVVPDNDSGDRSAELEQVIMGPLKDYVLLDNVDYKIRINYSYILGVPQQQDEFESLVNQVVSAKNYKKSQHKRKSDAKDNAELMDDLKRHQTVTRILDQNMFTYHYQPIIDVNKGTIYAYEALMRCEDEDITPFQILKSAEYLNRLPDIERATLLNVTEEVESNLELFGDAKVFINSIPGTSMSEEDEEEFISRVSRNMGKFVIEITEESELGDEQIDVLKGKYSNLGCRIAVDDYGSGYSNANNLLRYMPHFVKIDRMLISRIHKNPQKQHFVRNIIDFAHQNDIVALAEGVETKEEFEECLLLGIDLIQGYYVGRPEREIMQKIPDEIRAEIERFRTVGRGWNSVQGSLL